MANFFSLSREMRDQIYEYLVVWDEPISLKDASGFKSSSLAKRKELQVMLVRPYNAGMAFEARETFRRINTFTVEDPAAHPFQGYTKDQGIPHALVGSGSWIRHAVINIDSANDKIKIEKQTSFLRSLISYPFIRTLEIQICGTYGSLHKTATRFIEIAKVCVELKTRFGQHFKFGITGLWYSPFDYRTLWNTLWTDLSWLFISSTAIRDKRLDQDMTKLALRDLLPLQLAGMSISKKAHQRRDRTQDEKVMVILLLAYALQLELLPWKVATFMGVAHLKAKLRAWFKKRRLEDESARTTAFLDAYMQRNFTQDNGLLG